MISTIKLVNTPNTSHGWLPFICVYVRTFKSTLLANFKYVIEYNYSHHAVQYKIPRTYSLTYETLHL